MEEKVSTARVAIKYGVISAIALMVYTTILNVAGLSENKVLAMFAYIILIVGIALAMRNFKEENHGYMSFGEGMSVGSLVSAILALLASAFTMFYMQFIDNTITAKILDNARAEMEAKGMDDAQIDQAIAMSQKLMSPGIMFVFSILAYVIVGVVLSLIISLIIRKEKPVFE